MLKYHLKRECHQRLQNTFGLTEYRPGQKAAVHTLLSGRDLMCIFPTGSGKSLCWQIPAAVHQGITLVVSPLIALMRDQLMHLQAQGIPAVAIDSLLSSQERDFAIRQIQDGTARIIFVSPERLEQPAFIKLCRDITPWLVVVDEAHCVIQWGEEFRPAYNRIAEFIHLLPKRPVVCALTATADKAMQKAIAASLGMRFEKRILLPTIRENLRYEVRTTLHRQRELLRLLENHPCKTVVFCRTRERTERLSSALLERGIHASYYHAGLERQERLQVQMAFQEGSLQVLCATTAFGMGIDLPDIRRVIHDEMPDQLIDYVQQTGRGGRDGLPTDCILFFEPNDLLKKVKSEALTKERFRRRPIRRILYMNKYWKSIRQMLRIMFNSICIPQAIAAAFGCRIASCGQCSACRKGKMLEHVPSFAHMKQWQIRYWLLSWQRDALGAAMNINPGKLLPDQAMYAAAKYLALPPNVAVPKEIERLVAYFRK